MQQKTKTPIPVVDNNNNSEDNQYHCDPQQACTIWFTRMSAKNHPALFSIILFSTPPIPDSATALTGVVILLTPPPPQINLQ